MKLGIRVLKDGYWHIRKNHIYPVAKIRGGTNRLDDITFISVLRDNFGEVMYSTADIYWGFMEWCQC